MKCYRVSKRKFAVGDLFPLSNWSLYVQKNGNPAANHYEQKLEDLRIETNPLAQKRDVCLFAFEKLEDAEGFALKKEENHYIYELETKVGHFSIHNYNITSYMLKYISNNDISGIDSHHHLMRLYWLERDEDTYYGREIGDTPELIINTPPVVTNVY